jgi:hypothetical protein
MNENLSVYCRFGNSGSAFRSGYRWGRSARPDIRIKDIQRRGRGSFTKPSHHRLSSVLSAGFAQFPLRLAQRQIRIAAIGQRPAPTGATKIGADLVIGRESEIVAIAAGLQTILEPFHQRIANNVSTTRRLVGGAQLGIAPRAVVLANEDIGSAFVATRPGVDNTQD